MIHTLRDNSSYRFGIIVDDRGVSEWELRCILNLTESHIARLALILLLKPSQQVKTSFRDKSKMNNFIHWLYHWMFCRKTSLRQVQATVLMQKFEDVEQHEESISDQIADEPPDKEKLHRLDLDFVLGFTNPLMLWR